MNNDDTLEKQLEKEKECLDFIKLWFKGMIPATGVLWIVSFKLHIDFFTIPSILVTTGTALTSAYMLIQAKKFNHNIKSLNHKLYIQEVTNTLNEMEHTKQHNRKNHQKNKDYSYKPNNTYNNINLTTHSSKNYKVKKRVLKSSNIYTTKKSD